MVIKDVRDAPFKKVAPSHDEQAGTRCEEARYFEGIGEYEEARSALRELWQGVGLRPDLSGLSREISGEVLMRIGSLTGYLGSANQIEGAQEKALDLLFESRELFAESGSDEKVAEAQNCLGVCYWREGAFDTARVVLNDALGLLAQSNNDLRLSIMLNLAIVERSDGNVVEALRLQRAAEPLAEATKSEILKGRFHQGFSVTLSKMGELDTALIENSAASYYYEKAGHQRNCLAIENNIAYELCKMGKYSEALDHLDHALRVLREMKDKSLLPQVQKTRADVLLARKENEKARMAAKEAVHLLEQGDEEALLVDALIIYGTALARLRRTDEALKIFAQAHHHACEKLSLEAASGVGVVLIEELAGQLYVGAGKTFDESKLNFEASLIKEALYHSNRKTSGAALILGLTPQTLVAALKGRHHKLLPERTKIVERGKSIIVTSKKKKGDLVQMPSRKK